MSGHNQKIGNWGESVTVRHLEERGYRVIDRNVRTPYGEIDIVTQKDGFTIFVEVKTRTSKEHGPARNFGYRPQTGAYGGCRRTLCQRTCDRPLAN